MKRGVRRILAVTGVLGIGLILCADDPKSNEKESLR